MGLIDRLQRYGLFPDEPPAANGKGHAAPAATPEPVAEVKAVAPAPVVSFIPRDGNGNTIESPLYLSGLADRAHVTTSTAYAAAAYCYVAMRYRAEKLAEAPLMVVEETDDGEEWLTDHELAGFLDAPSPDYDMGELVALTRMYRDLTGSAIWVKDRDRGLRVGRLVPFSGDEFTVRQKDGRIFGEFELSAIESGKRLRRPEDVIYFRELNPGDWWRGVAPVDVALSMLNLGQRVTATAKALLKNAVLPSLVIQADKDWNPDEQAFREWIEQIQAQAQFARKGEPLAMTGGGNVSVVSARLKDLVPDELMDRVEATVAAVFGVPAVVLQYLVGLKNSPWSQMEEARRMCYEDTIVSLWGKDERTLTRQLLREVDDDPTHYIRFDRSRIAALRADDTKRAAVVAQLSEIWTMDEGRIYTGQEPLDDTELGNTIIAHARTKSLLPPPSLPGPGTPNPDPADDPVADDDDTGPEEKRLRRALEVKQQRMAFFEAVRADEEAAWELAVAMRLERDRAAVADALARLGGAKKAGDRITPAEAARLRRAAEQALSVEAWMALLLPLIERSAERAAGLVALDIAGAQLLRDDVLPYVEREAAWLVKEIDATTRNWIADTVARGIEEGRGSMDIARDLETLPAFDRDRAKLVARTETTRVMNGAPQEALAERSRRTGRKYVKTWWAVLDDRVRDEHADLHGEQQSVDQPFSNGLQAPGEPNCRCTLLYSAVSATGEGE